MKCRVCGEKEGKEIKMPKGIIKDVLDMEGQSLILCETCLKIVLQLIINYLKGLNK